MISTLLCGLAYLYCHKKMIGFYKLMRFSDCPVFMKHYQKYL